MPNVKMSITEELIAEVFRLTAVGPIVGASFTDDPHGVGLVELEIEAEHAPEGAREMVPAYERTTGIPDPVRITGITWVYVDGSSEHRPLGEL
jgi:hypothetical protein